MQNKLELHEPTSTEMSTSPNKPAAKAAPHLDPSAIALPSSPQATRGLRRLQSHQTLSSNSPSLITQQRHQLQQQRNTSSGQKDVRDQLQQSMLGLSLNTSLQSNRTRANSDAAVPSPGSTMRSQSGLRKQPQAHNRKSSLENLLRDGPTKGEIDQGLRGMRWLVLSKRVEAEKDGMVRMTLFVPLGITATNRDLHSLFIAYTSGWLCSTFLLFLLTTT